MIEISYWMMLTVISVVWVFLRVICWVRARRVSWKRELQLLLVYSCIIVVVRFTFCPFELVDGQIQPLLFDAEQIVPMWVNFEPLIHLFEYPTMKKALLNLIGNTAMFIPLGIVWPAVFYKLDTHGKVIAAGFGVSLTIELLQLPFFGRATDVDDLILNTLGYLIGYGIYLLVKKLRRRTVCC